jgi:hypothetical protein
MANFDLRKKLATMAAQRDVPVKQIQRPGGSENIPGIDPFWFSALQPTVPTAPQSYRPRVWPFLPGINKVWQPREEMYDRVPFELLYRCSDEWDLWSAAMETVIDKILSLDWQIRKMGSENDKTPEAKNQAVDDPIAQKLTAFFERPARIAGMDTFKGWGNKVLTDMYIGDCATIWVEKNMLGQILSFTPVDGSTIKVFVDDTGRRPCEIDPETGKKAAAYAQVAYGLPAIDFTEDEIIYAVRKPRNKSQYGRSHLEQILTWANIGIRSQQFLLAYYTEGNMPEMLIPVDAGMPAEKIEQWNTLLDANLSGELGERRKIKMVPSMSADGKMQVITPKEPLLKSEVDEWLARIICFTIGLNPQAFVKSMNRATSESAQDQAEAEGQQPVIEWFEDVVNECIRRLGYGDDYEFTFRVRREQDGLKQMQIDTGYLKTGVWTINMVLVDLGMDPVDEPWADVHMIETPQGAVPVELAAEGALLQKPQVNAPTTPAAPGSQPSTKEQVEAVKKNIAEVVALVKRHHPDSARAVDSLEAKLTRKLKEEGEKVAAKIKEKKS